MPDVCPICGGLGLVTRDVPVNHPDFGKAFPCVCQAENVKSREAARLRRMGNLDAYVEKTFATFEIDFDILEPKDAPLRAVFRNMSDEMRHNLDREYRGQVNAAAERSYTFALNPRGWLLFKGNYGTGKTHLAAAIGNYWLSRGEPVLFITTPDLLDHLRGTYGPNSEIAYDALFEQVRSTSLLIVDDLGAESQTPWAVEKLYQLFNDRHRFERPTVITTNRDPMLIEGRIRSRLFTNNFTEIVTLQIPDRRSASQTWQESDLTYLGRYQDMTFDTFEARAREGIAQEHVDRLAETLRVVHEYVKQPQGWLVLIGEAGTGKTHLAASIAHVWNAEGKRPLFVTAADLLSHLRSTFRPESTISYDTRMEEIKRADVLILDDLSIDSRSSSAWARDKLYEILLYRFDCDLPTVITSAQPLSEMDSRLRSRMTNESHSHIEALTVPSYRGKKRRARPPRY